MPERTPPAPEILDEVLEIYPENAREDRTKHMSIADASTTDCGVTSNRKTVPGVMTARGCAYAGSKGVVWGPIKDMVHISHGPVGCGQYSWASRRNYYSGTSGIDCFADLQITSDFNEQNIVFGGDKKLEGMIDEIEQMFPLNRGISIQSECPVGLIGDDIESVARARARALEKPVIPVRCEGFRGVSQSLGHHIANDAMRDHIYEQGATAAPLEPGPYDVALIGDYNIGGDAWGSRRVLEDMGLRVVSQATGDASVRELANVGKSRLVLLHCYRSMNYVARYLEEKFGVPWLEFNFFGPTQIAKSMRAIAQHFDSTIQKRTERLISETYEPFFENVRQKYLGRLEGKEVMLYVGGLRPRHTIPVFEDLGMKASLTGYEFGHNDDYQRTLPYLQDKTVIVDDLNQYEMEKFIEYLRPDMVGSGIKEKYQVQKSGVPFRQMHSWDYSGPYHGVEGFETFARDIDMAVNAPIWKNITPPWKPSTTQRQSA